VSGLILGRPPILNIHRILLPVDLEDASLPAVSEAMALARHFRASIVFLHLVVPLDRYADELQPGQGIVDRAQLAQLVAQAETRLDKSIEVAFQGLAVKRIVLESDEPANAIVQTAQDEGVDLIAMSTHGHASFIPSVLGSVTAKVLHASHCPVWTSAHLEARAPSDLSIHNVLCAIDLTESSRRTIRWAADVAAEFAASLTLAYVATDLEMYGPGGTYVDPGWKEKLFSSAARQIADLQRELGIGVKVLMEGGHVGTTLSRIAKQIGADLLVIGGHPAGDQLRAAGYEVIRESHIPVLSV
jgi:nucleotide-binding universal stress UspA family protein